MRPRAGIGGRRIGTIAVHLLLGAWLASTSSGCAVHQWFRRHEAAAAFVPLPANVSKTDLVARLNENILRTTSWRSTDVSVTSPGMPVSLNGRIAVESPRNFRLIMSSLGGNEADLGSNSEEFWFWMRRAEPHHVFHARHDQADRVQRRLQIPFQPDWLMEALGVIPVNEAQVEMFHPAAGGDTVDLVCERAAPDGRPVRRVTTVDVTRGVIVSHSLFDTDGRLLARALFAKHQHEAEGTILPHAVTLEWPQNGMALKMAIGRIEVNPSSQPVKTWELPVIPGYEPFDLGR